MTTESKRYQKQLEENEKKWEELCQRCGACCGAYDDPCLHLKKDKQNKFFCNVYPERFGIKKSQKGEIFKCVPIRQLLSARWKKGRYCAYKKLIK